VEPTHCVVGIRQLHEQTERRHGDDNSSDEDLK
jgi:hypothetical protein